MKVLIAANNHKLDMVKVTLNLIPCCVPGHSSYYRLLTGHDSLINVLLLKKE